MSKATGENEPYCSNCGYALTGLTDSARCPECGRPLVEVLTRPSFHAAFSKRYQSDATIFGYPVISIAFGPRGRETRGHARGLIAIGDVATGGIALGGIARGIVALGGVAIGVFSFGGCALGLFSALGGLAVSTGIAVGGGAVGTFAIGGGAAGIFAQGGGAIGMYTRSGMGVSSASAEAFDQFTWLFGSWPPKRGSEALGLLVPAAIPILLSVSLSTVIGLLALIRLKGSQDIDQGKDDSIRA